MADHEYEQEYLKSKKRLRTLHQNLKDTREVQEIYHKLVGSAEGPQDQDVEDSESSK